MPLSEEQQEFVTRMGIKVRKRRVELGITQARLAELAAIQPRTVQKIEAGQLNLLITTMLRLKQALKCRWEDLLGR